jgi:hypothetical protein
MPKKKHPLIKALRFRIEKTRAKKIMSEKYGIKGEIPEYLLSKPEYQMSFYEYCNFHLVSAIINTKTPSHVHARLQRDHIEVILKALQENKPDIPFAHLELIKARYSNKLTHPKEELELKNYLKSNGLKFFAGEVVKIKK